MNFESSGFTQWQFSALKTIYLLFTGKFVLSTHSYIWRTKFTYVQEKIAFVNLPIGALPLWVKFTSTANAHQHLTDEYCLHLLVKISFYFTNELHVDKILYNNQLSQLWLIFREIIGLLLVLATYPACLKLSMATWTMQMCIDETKECHTSLSTWHCTGQVSMAYW